MCRRWWGFELFVLVLLANMASAEDRYYCVPLADLEIVEGTLPRDREPDWRKWRSARRKPAYAILDGEGEAYVRYAPTHVSNFRLPNAGPDANPQHCIAVHVAHDRNVSGRLFLPTFDVEGMQVVSFKIPSQKANVESRKAFYETKLAHYEKLVEKRLPGSAWFRHEARQARIALRETAVDETIRRPRRRARNDLAATYALFSGGRAVSENLQLDRALPAARVRGVGAREFVDVNSLEGITIREIDWKPLIKELSPNLDPLASKIPADQHAIFFPSFNAAVTMADEMAEQGAPILQMAEPRSVSARTLERYQKQMCLTISGLARVLGPTFCKSVAVTGSDPYFRTGTDVAVLFETDDAAKLESLLLAQVGLATAQHQDARQIDGTVRGLRYRGARSSDRSICSYIAKADGLVIVTNSPFQLEQLALVISGETPSLASLDEYVFFRDRYTRGDESETAFLFLSDATIRRWCGPRWRIATSRRTRYAAVLAELQARQLDRLVNGDAQTGPIYSDLSIADNTEFTLTPKGVECSTIGSLAFMTPIAEMDIQRVTKAEADGYRQWRNGYQSNWSWAFDPVGLRVTVSRQQLGADLTIMPLIWRSEYREMISISQGVELEPDAGDIHDALAHAIIAVNTKSPSLQQYANMLRFMAGNVSIEPLSWLGDNVGVYVDADPFWKELAAVESDQLEKFLDEEGWRIPVAVRVDVSSGMKLAMFITAVRGFIEQSSPGMLQWETLSYRDQPYVRITPTERAIGRSENLRNLAICYVASGQSFTITPNEALLKRAIDREVDRKTSKNAPHGAGPAKRTWIGSNVGLQADQRILGALAALNARHYQQAMQDRAWGNLAILNEWKHRYGDKNPVELHERFWHERLLCPGGGEYVWNDQWQTMESTVYGCPAAPKKGPSAPPMLQVIKRADFGLTFEHQGLRARVKLER